jgi:ElaB/YqjD/DUF883 family membrane-anchored ribosome-binding protein
VNRSERLADEFGDLLSDAQDLLRRAAHETGDTAHDLRAQVDARLGKARMRLQDLEGDAMHRARRATHAADRLVHEQPWRAMAVAAAMGLIVGLMLGRL